MRYSLVLIYIFFFNHMFSQDVQQVEVLKNDKQVTELFDEIGDSEIKLDVIDFLTQPALNVGYEIINQVSQRKVKLKKCLTRYHLNMIY